MAIRATTKQKQKLILLKKIRKRKDINKTNEKLQNYKSMFLLRSKKPIWRWKRNKIDLDTTLSVLKHFFYELDDFDSVSLFVCCLGIWPKPRHINSYTKQWILRFFISFVFFCFLNMPRIRLFMRKCFICCFFVASSS